MDAKPEERDNNIPDIFHMLKRIDTALLCSRPKVVYLGSDLYVFLQHLAREEKYRDVIEEVYRNPGFYIPYILSSPYFKGEYTLNEPKEPKEPKEPEEQKDYYEINL